MHLCFPQIICSCWSEIGMVGGVQEVSIQNTDSQGYTCATKGIAMHELFHALGRFHEQNRSDRDDYVTVVNSNVARSRPSLYVSYGHVNLMTM